ncbi:MAG: hypothetical protein ACREQ9_13100 [Candidatus Binatia bacterium]
MEVGVLMVPLPRRAADTARLAEGLGFDTLLFPDSFLWVIPGSTGMPRDPAAASLASFAAEVLPALRS